jgi:hypothetical protein
MKMLSKIGYMMPDSAGGALLGGDSEASQLSHFIDERSSAALVSPSAQVCVLRMAMQ